MGLQENLLRGIYAYGKYNYPLVFFLSLIIVIIGCIIYDITVKFELLIVHKFRNEVLHAFFSPCD